MQALISYNLLIIKFRSKSLVTSDGRTLKKLSEKNYFETYVLFNQMKVFRNLNKLVFFHDFHKY